jgi:5-methylcytosine-specific restriction protein A
MPSCCGAMRDEAKPGGADIIYETDSGQSASLTIRYNISR